LFCLRYASPSAKWPSAISGNDLVKGIIRVSVLSNFPVALYRLARGMATRGRVPAGRQRLE